MTELYSPSNVQELLGIDSSTLRKYATLLEGHGYHIHRNNRGHRGYVEKDVNTLRKLIELSKQEGMTADRSVEAVLTRDFEEQKAVNDVKTITTQQKTNDRLIEQGCNHDELVERIEHLEQVNGDLIKLLKEKAIREAYLEEKINQILKVVERTEQLVAESKMIEETIRQIAATSQKKWWKWW
ncbi:DNA-binding transcriptional MerR regulator [Neobacillus niacini]|uniref:MerR family transcriptional regulator n=1 Tax=Neobacillus niacini TaxID=86668 RepID=UPI002861C142|nr:MerR family transcriptional regulator [Neobacillus niacini]MDR7079258.1 DNA-binding transcriptional MerR regulator [Neobacillus niacini]